MLRRRLIPVLFIKNGLIVRSEDFSYHQNIGNIVNQAARYNEWDVDELIYLDISRQKFYDSRRDDHKIKTPNSIEAVIQAIAAVCFMPLTMGGGIRSLADIELRVKHGADKIALNTGAILNPQLIESAARNFGSQCVVLSVDYRVIDGIPCVFSHHGQQNTAVHVLDWIRQGEDRGAGEVLLNCIDRDGKASGYDLATINLVVENTRLPVIACGGAGNEYDLVELAEQSEVAAIAVGNWFHFVERSYPRAKQLLKKKKLNFR